MFTPGGTSYSYYTHQCKARVGLDLDHQNAKRVEVIKVQTNFAKQWNILPGRLDRYDKKMVCHEDLRAEKG